MKTITKILFTILCFIALSNSLCAQSVTATVSGNNLVISYSGISPAYVTVDQQLASPAPLYNTGHACYDENCVSYCFVSGNTLWVKITKSSANPIIIPFDGLHNVYGLDPTADGKPQTVGCTFYDSNNNWMFGAYLNYNAPSGGTAPKCPNKAPAVVITASCCQTSSTSLYLGYVDNGVLVQGTATISASVVNVNDYAPLKFAWTKDGVAIASYDNPIASFLFDLADNGTYVCNVTDVLGHTASAFISVSGGKTSTVKKPTKPGKK